MSTAIFMLTLGLVLTVKGGDLLGLARFLWAEGFPCEIGAE